MILFFVIFNILGVEQDKKDQEKESGIESESDSGNETISSENIEVGYPLPNRGLSKEEYVSHMATRGSGKSAGSEFLTDIDAFIANMTVPPPPGQLVERREDTVVKDEEEEEENDEDEDGATPTAELPPPLLTPPWNSPQQEDVFSPLILPPPPPEASNQTMDDVPMSFPVDLPPPLVDKTVTIIDKTTTPPREEKKAPIQRQHKPFDPVIIQSGNPSVVPSHTKVMEEVKRLNAAKVAKELQLKAAKSSPPPPLSPVVASPGKQSMSPRKPAPPPPPRTVTLQRSPDSSRSSRTNSPEPTSAVSTPGTGCTSSPVPSPSQVKMSSFGSPGPSPSMVRRNIMPSLSPSQSRRSLSPLASPCSSRRSSGHLIHMDKDIIIIEKFDAIRPDSPGSVGSASSTPLSSPSLSRGGSLTGKKTPPPPPPRRSSMSTAVAHAVTPSIMDKIKTFSLPKAKGAQGDPSKEGAEKEASVEEIDMDHLPPAPPEFSEKTPTATEPVEAVLPNVVVKGPVPNSQYSENSPKKKVESNVTPDFSVIQRALEHGSIVNQIQKNLKEKFKLEGKSKSAIPPSLQASGEKCHSVDALDRVKASSPSVADTTNSGSDPSININKSKLRSYCSPSFNRKQFSFDMGHSTVQKQSSSSGNAETKTGGSSPTSPGTRSPLGRANTFTGSNGVYQNADGSQISPSLVKSESPTAAMHKDHKPAPLSPLTMRHKSPINATTENKSLNPRGSPLAQKRAAPSLKSSLALTRASLRPVSTQGLSHVSWKFLFLWLFY